MSRTARWRTRLDAIAAAGQTRRIRTLLPTGPVTGIVGGREVLVACSNDYLGLSWQVRARGHGAGGSRLISGSRPAHATLERHLEEWLGRPALLFPSGYQANLAVFSTVCDADQTVASDALVHASIIDGLRLSRASRVVVPHADPRAVPAHVDLIALEGLFSMDGDIPPFGRYPTSPWMAVDEAHAIGCLGPDGRGAAAAAGMVPDILIGTFGKAFGAAGAFVSGPPELIELLINAGRSFIFTTAPPESVANAALEGLRRMREEPGLRERLAHNAATLRAHLAALGWEVLGSAHILPVVAGDGAMRLASQLLERGVFAPAIRWPTVPRGAERVRLTVSAAHTEADLTRIADAFGPRPTA
jgi:8-amino-7-oxononanoate synthase